MNWKDYFDYDETSPSCLRWKVSTSNRVKAGDPAATTKVTRGVLRYHVFIKGNHYYCHRIIWEMFNGVIPESVVVDHIENNTETTCDNRICNLRLCSGSDNVKKSRKSKANSSGFKGVSFNKNLSKYKASICVDKKQIHLGYFEDKIKAAQSYDQAAQLYHGNYAITNKSLGLY